MYRTLKVRPFALAGASRETFIVITSDDTISRSVYVEGGFEFEKLQKVVSLLGPGFRLDTLIDIGANIGTICIPAVCRGFARSAIAIEPEPRNFSVLTANIWLNGLSEKIRAHNVALGSESDRLLEFELSPDNSGDHRIRVSSESGLYLESSRKIISVRSMRYDDVVGAADRGSQLIWIDTQGYEGVVLQGAAGATSTRVPIVTEFWPYGMKRAASYGLFKQAVLNYESFFDLSQISPSAVAVSESSIDALYRKLGESENVTDLLLR